MSAPMTPEREQQIRELAEMSSPDSAIAHAVDEVDRLRAELTTERKRSRELREREAIAHDQLASAVGRASSMVWPDLIRTAAELAARPTRAEVYREAAAEADRVGSVYASSGENDAAWAAFGLMENLYRKANEVEYAATPCSTPNACDGDEACDNHERLLAHHEGEHAFCGDECTAERDDAGKDTRKGESTRVQCNDCGAVGEVFVADDGLSYLDPSGQIGHQASSTGGVRLFGESAADVAERGEQR